MMACVRTRVSPLSDMCPLIVQVDARLQLAPRPTAELAAGLVLTLPYPPRAFNASQEPLAMLMSVSEINK
jgi:hypothetical protein